VVLESEFVRIAVASEIQEGKMKKVKLDCNDIIIVNVVGNYFAEVVCIRILEATFPRVSWKEKLLLVQIIKQNLMSPQ
jgi:hypothetical protein